MFLLLPFAHARQLTLTARAGAERRLDRLLLHFSFDAVPHLLVLSYAVEISNTSSMAAFALMLYLQEELLLYQHHGNWSQELPFFVGWLVESGRSRRDRSRLGFGLGKKLDRL